MVAFAVAIFPAIFFPLLSSIVAMSFINSLSHAIFLSLIFKYISFIFIGKLKPFKAIKAKTVAKAIFQIIKNNRNDIYFTSDKLEELGKN